MDPNIEELHTSAQPVNGGAQPVNGGAQPVNGGAQPVNGGAQPHGGGVPPHRFVHVIGTSAAIRRVFTLVDRVAPTEAGVLLTGESGVGKELIAEAIHQHSRRAAGPMIAVNCASLPATLIEAELFGYEKGSFTGASRSHAGVFERANGGTLLLDEITEMPLDMQTRLLRVLETGRFYRVGGTNEIRTNMRVIAATNRDLARAVQAKHLREDIMYRLAVFPIRVPPLRERGDDRVLLAETFLERLNSRHATSKRFTPESFATLWEHDWPGNVRELKNVIERAFIMADHTLDVSQATLISRRNASEPALDGPYADVPGIRVTLGSRLDQAERSLIEATLHHFEGNKRRTAETLGCSLKTLYNKLHTYARQ